MKNLPVIAKMILYFFIAIAVFDLVYLGYTFSVASAAVDDALNIISLQVAEENCLDTNPNGKFEDSQYYASLKALANNCPLWLAYNPEPIERIFNTNTQIPARPVNLSQIGTKYGISSESEALKKAINNIFATQNKNYSTATGKSALILSKDGSAVDDASLYSYETCPQRGEAITITITGYYKVHLLAPNNILDVNIPITRSVTVIGMKFYKGK